MGEENQKCKEARSIKCSSEVKKRRELEQRALAAHVRVTGPKSTGSTRPGSGTSAGSAHSNRTGSGVKKYRSQKQWRQRKKHQRTFR